MRLTDRLYQETLVRVGPDELVGVQRLVKGKHYGIAEKHTVSKLMSYVKDLEKQLGIDVPDPKTVTHREGLIRINTSGVSYFA